MHEEEKAHKKCMKRKYEEIIKLKILLAVVFYDQNSVFEYCSDYASNVLYKSFSYYLDFVILLGFNFIILERFRVSRFYLNDNLRLDREEVLNSVTFYFTTEKFSLTTKPKIGFFL